MANVQTDNGEKQSLVKCTNSKALETIRDAVSSAFTSVLSQSKNLSEEQCQRCTRRFHEIYENALSQTIELRGQLWNARTNTSSDTSMSSVEKPANSTPENTDRVDYFYDSVLPRLDATIVKVTQKRKTCPKVCVEHLKKKLKLQKEALENMQVVISKPANVYLLSDQDNATLLTMASQNAAEWARCKQTTESLIKRAQQVKEVQTKLKSITSTSSVELEKTTESKKGFAGENLIMPLKLLHSCDVTVSDNKHRHHLHESTKSVLCKIAD